METAGTLHKTWINRLAALLAIGVVVLGMASVTGPASPAYAADDGGFAQRMLDLVNQQRASAQVPPLQWSDSLGAAAQDGRYDGCGFAVSGRATDMGARNYFSHSILGCGTQGVPNLLAALGLQTTASGENIGWMSGTTDPLIAAERLTNDLLASPAHRANMLSPDFTHIGIGSWHTATGASWSGGGTALRNVFITAQVFAKMSSTTTTTAPKPTTTTTAPAPTTTTTVPKPTTTTIAPAPTSTTTIASAPLPGAPTAVVAAGGDASIPVSWSPAASGPAVDSYGAFAWDATGYTGHYVTVCATCRTATVPGLVNGRTYYVTVYGHNAAGWGPAGTSGWVTVAAVPGAPTEVKVTPGNASVTATWRGPTNPGTAIDGYGVFIYDGDGYTGKWTWACATCTTATVAGLVNGRTYVALVYAHNPNVWGTATISDYVVAGTPGAPGNVVATRANAAVNVSWSAAANSGAAVDLYGLFAYDANGYTGIYSTACATCTTGSVPGLANGHAYTIVVYAHNALGWGASTASGQVVPSAG
jgi:uncharacterized protein YkwD